MAMKLSGIVQVWRVPLTPREHDQRAMDALIEWCGGERDPHAGIWHEDGSKHDGAWFTLRGVPVRAGDYVFLSDTGHFRTGGPDYLAAFLGITPDREAHRAELLATVEAHTTPAGLERRRARQAQERATAAADLRAQADKLENVKTEGQA